MTPQELHELDAWLADNVMGMRPAESLNFRPTRSAADALTLISRLRGKYGCDFKVGTPEDTYLVTFLHGHYNGRGEHKELTVAVCLAAKAAVLALFELKRTLP